jgi:hypothetical protein
MKEATTPVITVVVADGLVRDVRVPDNAIVVVHDYDDEETFDPTLPNVHTDENGQLYVKKRWAALLGKPAGNKVRPRKLAPALPAAPTPTSKVQSPCPEPKKIKR